MEQSVRTIYWDSVPTERGEVVLMATEKGICWAGTPGTPVDSGVSWVSRHMRVGTFVRKPTFPLLAKTRTQLLEYMKGERTRFDGPFDLQGTPFQKAVWQAMLNIPYGHTKTYGQIAREVGKPLAVRAVGGACNANPVAILVPCHRIVGSNGNLTGYGGGLPTKEWLLKLEKYLS